MMHIHTRRSPVPTLVALVLAGSFSTQSAIADDSLDVFALLAGSWGGNQDNTCGSNPHVITFSADYKRATFTYKEAPRNRYERSRIPAERQSPEASDTAVIQFNVLASGDDWVALRRQDETELDRLGKPRAWKLTLGNDFKSYGWWLYNSVVWKKSLLRGERCSTVPTGPGVSVVSVDDDQIDPVLEQLVGLWEADVHVMGKPVVYRAEGRFVLQGAFLRLTIADVSPSAAYESVIYIGLSKKEGDYVAHWMDIHGADSARFLGVGRVVDSVLDLDFKNDESVIRQSFRLYRERALRSDRFDLLVTMRKAGMASSDEVISFRFKRSR